MKKEQDRKKKRVNPTNQQNGQAPKTKVMPKDKTAPSPKSPNRKPSLIPVKKDSHKKKGEMNSLVKTFRAVSQFFRDARMELKKVKWPTRKELMAVTMVVIVLVLIASLYLGILDYGLIKLIKNLSG